MIDALVLARAQFAFTVTDETFECESAWNFAPLVGDIGVEK